MDRFSQMVKNGVASFHYKVNAQPTPCLDPLVLTYNRFWGLATDTHMSLVEDIDVGDAGNILNPKNDSEKRYIITGNMFTREERYFNRMQYDTWIRGIYSPSSGYNSLYEFFTKNGYDYKKITYNGQNALELIKTESQNEPCVCSPCYYDTPCSAYSCCGIIRDCAQRFYEDFSKIEKIPGTIKKIFSESEKIGEFVKNVNESDKVTGKFTVLGGNLYCTDTNSTLYRVI